VELVLCLPVALFLCFMSVCQSFGLAQLLFDLVNQLTLVVRPGLCVLA
jgi:hypothetical protein